MAGFSKSANTSDGTKRDLGLYFEIWLGILCHMQRLRIRYSDFLSHKLTGKVSAQIRNLKATG